MGFRGKLIYKFFGGGGGGGCLVISAFQSHKMCFIKYIRLVRMALCIIYCIHVSVG